MSKDYRTKRLTIEQCEAEANLWRKRFGVNGLAIVDTLKLVRNEAARYQECRGLKVVGRPDNHMGTREGYSRRSVKRIYLRESRLLAAEQLDGFARFVLGHEFFHYLHHPGDPKLFSQNGHTRAAWIEEEQSAETQADNFSMSFHMPRSIVETCDSQSALGLLTGMPFGLAEKRLNQVWLISGSRPIPSRAVSNMQALRASFLCGICGAQKSVSVGNNSYCEECKRVSMISEDTY